MHAQDGTQDGERNAAALLYRVVAAAIAMSAKSVNEAAAYLRSIAQLRGCGTLFVPREKSAP